MTTKGSFSAELSDLICRLAPLFLDSARDDIYEMASGVPGTGLGQATGGSFRFRSPALHQATNEVFDRDDAA